MNIIREWTHRFRNSPFIRDVLVLVTGTTIAQVLPIIILPILTNYFYSTSDFGNYAFFISIYSVLSIVICARYELAIVIPSEDSDALDLVKLSLILTFIIGGVLLITALGFSRVITMGLGATNYYVLLHAIFVTIIIGLFQIGYLWNNRLKKFKLLSIAKIFRSGVSVLTQLMMGIIGLGYQGLIYGVIVGQSLPLFLLFSNKNLKKRLKGWRIDQIVTSAKKFNNFPKYALPGGLINSLSNQSPVLAFKRYFSDDLVGQYGLTFMVLSVPISLIATAVLDVFKQKASEEYANTGSCHKTLLSTFKGLVLVSIVPFTILAVFGPFLFQLVFGSEWRTSGEFAQILAVMFLLKFSISPLSYVMHITNNQKSDLIWQIFLFLLTIVSIAYGVRAGNIMLSVKAFSLSYSGMYIVYFWLCYRVSKGKAH